MRYALVLWLLTAATICGVVSVRGQERTNQKAEEIPYIKVIDCLDCNDLFITLPTPKYPAYVGYGPHQYNGSVAIQVSIMNNGRVGKATAISGHPYFRPILEREAMSATFKPDIVDGSTRTGVILFLVVSKADNAEKVGLGIKRKLASKVLSCGVCNQNALFLPKPYYPEAAKSVGAAGKVAVEILIDENGRVQSAKAISGHIFLRIASEQAALKSLFTPMTLGKVPVRSTGVVIYDFKR